MLKSRATTQIARALFADVLMGVKYTPEEVAAFAEPELLDADPVGLAERTMGAPPQPALNPTPPVRINADTGEILDTTPEPDSVVAKQMARRTFAPPVQAALEPFTDADATLADRNDIRDLLKAYGALTAEQKQLVAVQMPASTHSAVHVDDYAKMVAAVTDAAAASTDEEPF